MPTLYTITALLLHLYNNNQTSRRSLPCFEGAHTASALGRVLSEKTVVLRKRNGIDKGTITGLPVRYARVYCLLLESQSAGLR